MVEKGKFDTFNTHIVDASWHGTDISIISGGFKLFNGVKPLFLVENKIQIYK